MIHKLWTFLGPKFRCLQVSRLGYFDTKTVVKTYLNSISGLFEIGFFCVRIFISGLCCRLSDFLSRWLRVKKAETERTKSFGILFHLMWYSEWYKPYKLKFSLCLRAVCTKKRIFEKSFWLGQLIRVLVGVSMITMMILLDNELGSFSQCWTWEHNNWFVIGRFGSNYLFPAASGWCFCTCFRWSCTLWKQNYGAPS